MTFSLTLDTIESFFLVRLRMGRTGKNGLEKKGRRAAKRPVDGPQGSLMAKRRHDVPASRKRAPDDDRPSPREVFQNGSLNGRHRNRPQKPGEPPGRFPSPVPRK